MCVRIVSSNLSVKLSGLFGHLLGEHPSPSKELLLVHPLDRDSLQLRVAEEDVTQRHVVWLTARWEECMEHLGLLLGNEVRLEQVLSLVVLVEHLLGRCQQSGLSGAGW